MGRPPCCDKDGLKKGPWTPEEDLKLVNYITHHGYGNWRTLPNNAGLQRCGKSCRLRWTNYLRPDIKRGKFSLEEEETIIQLHRVLGNKWSVIAGRLPGRTDNEIKNYWNTHIRKRLLRMGIDPVTHKPRLDLLNLSTMLNTPFNGPTSQINTSKFLANHQQLFGNPELLRLLASSLVTDPSPPDDQEKHQVDQNQLLEPLLSQQSQVGQNPSQENPIFLSFSSQTRQSSYEEESKVDVHSKNIHEDLMNPLINYEHYDTDQIIMNSPYRESSENYCSNTVKLEVPNILDVNEYLTTGCFHY